MNAEQLNKLKELAQAAPEDYAPPAPYEEDRRYSAGEIAGLNFIAAANPVAVLELIALAEKATPPVSEVTDESHPDDIAVNKFSVAMKAKMAASRIKGRGGWDDPEQCDVTDLCRMLVDHVEKGDPVDVGNFAMMLFNRGARPWELTTALAVYSTPAPADQSYPALHDCEAVAKYAGREHPSGIGVNPVVEPETAGRESAAPAAPVASGSLHVHHVGTPSPMPMDAAMSLMKAGLSNVRAEFAAQTQPVAEQGELPQVHRFLLGESALDGVWFGDSPPAGRGTFWWRTELREAITASQQAASARADDPSEVERLSLELQNQREIAQHWKMQAIQQPQDEREAFEAWCRSVGRDDRDLQRCADYTTTITGNDYSWGDTERAWKAWQARAALAKKGGAA